MDAIQMLGQSGLRIVLKTLSIYIDPYLSNSVSKKDGSKFDRMLEIPIPPDQITDAGWILITHEHLDHCDPDTLLVIANASPHAMFIGPPPVVTLLKEWGIDPNRIHYSDEKYWRQLTDDVKVIAVPGAHPSIVRDKLGLSNSVGYILDYNGIRLLHTGDTLLNDEVLLALKQYLPIHTAFIPVNERNYFRDRLGIIGNMTVREAYGLATELQVNQLIPIHWDMFALNETTIEEIQVVYEKIKPSFSLLIKPDIINLSEIHISIIIRTLNEEKYLNDLLVQISKQDISPYNYEVIVVDSGSEDSTLDIAKKHGCRIVHIPRTDFSFGRSLNLGCEKARGEYLVIISGHCVPIGIGWLKKIIEPLINGQSEYSYGRQIGGDSSQYSEKRIFAKYFPNVIKRGQNDIYCNNANSAIRKSTWKKYRFDEELTGLEDIELAQRLVNNGSHVIYNPEAAVYHYHEETWTQIKRRFEREAIALQRIMPNIHISKTDLIRYLTSSIYKDFMESIRDGSWAKQILNIVLYRWNQYLGSYIGNNELRILSKAEKEKYFYPN